MDIKMDLHYTVAAQTDVGISKDINQDSLTVKVANVGGKEAAIAIICDGMGGLEQGEVASAVVTKNYEQWFLRDFPVLIEQKIPMEHLKDIWNNLAIDCNMRIFDYSSKRQCTMGTTLTVMLLYEGKYYVTHVGDCRIYKMSQDIEQITTDQTYVAREVALGHMTYEQAQNDRRRNVLLQCIGTGRDITPDFETGDVNVGDTFLLCSDGFRHVITQKEIYENCHNELIALEWVTQTRQINSKIMNKRLYELIELNKQRLEKDNISAILIKVF